jgi:hypothetical protein
LRVFLANYFADGDQPVSVNHMTTSVKSPFGSIASARHLFSDALGIDAGDLSHDECDAMRPDMYRALAAQASGPVYMKIHDANIAAPSGEPLIPPEATRRAICLVRNPLDVAVSFANHSRQPIAKTIDNMADAHFAFCSRMRGLPNQLRQRLLSWHEHVATWVDTAEFPVHVVRYEDMLARPEVTFGAVVRTLELPEEAGRLSRAIAFSSFEELRRQEDAAGFCEAPPNVERFFYQGKAGSWREHLSPEQVRQVIDAHGAVMQRFGYLDAAGQPAASLADVA